MRYDVFISYARLDNRRDDSPKWVDHLLDELQRQHRRVTTVDLRIFFDPQIEIGADWRWRLHNALRESTLLLPILSDAYFRSDWCFDEWDSYRRHELDRQVGGDGVLPVKIEGALDPPPAPAEAGRAQWPANLMARNYLALPRIWTPGDASTLIEVLDQNLSQRLARARAAQAAPQTLGEHNPAFVGRAQQRTRLRMALSGDGAVDAIAVVHGLAGVGKTSLVTEYAHDHAAVYGGRRYLIACAGRESMTDVLIEVGLRAGMTFADDEKARPDLAAMRVLATLEAAVAAAAADVPEAACLVVLDGVDRPGLLSSHETSVLAGRPWLHVVATTLLQPDALATPLQRAGRRREFVPLDELPPDEAVELLARHQPGGTFRDDGEAAAARDVARMLGGFPLALEAVATYLGVNAELADFRGMATRLAADGLGEADKIAGEVDLPHSRDRAANRFSTAVAPLLGSLTDLERYVLRCAATLPPENVPIPWLEELARARFPDALAAAPGHPDPWLLSVRRLIGRRLLIATGDVDADGRPRVARMQGLLQQHCLATSPEPVAPLRRAVMEVVFAHSKALFDGGMRSAENHWELTSLIVTSEGVGDDDPSAALALSLMTGYVAQMFGWFGRSAVLLRHAERLATTLQNETLVAATGTALGNAQAIGGEFAASEASARRALAAAEKVLAPSHWMIGAACSQLGMLAFNTGRFSEARAMLERAVKGLDERPDADPFSKISPLAMLALVEFGSGDSAAADRSLDRIAAIRQLDRSGQLPFALVFNDTLYCLPLVAVRRLADAEPIIREASLASRSVFPETQPLRHMADFVLCTILILQNRTKEARAIAIPAVEQMAAMPERPMLIQAAMRRTIALSFAREGKAKEAFAAYDACLEELAKGGQSEGLLAADIYRNIGQLAARRLQIKRAFFAFDRAFAIRIKECGRTDPSTAAAAVDLYEWVVPIALNPRGRRSLGYGPKDVETFIVRALEHATLPSGAPHPTLVRFRKLKRELGARILILLLLALGVLAGTLTLAFYLGRMLFRAI